MSSNTLQFVGSECQEVTAPVALLLDRHPDITEEVVTLLKAAEVAVESVGHPMASSDVGSGFDRAGCTILAIDRMSRREMEWLSSMIAPELPPCIVIVNECGVPDAVQAMKIGTHHIMTPPLDAVEFVDTVRGAIGLHARRREENLVRAGIRTRMGTLTVRENEVTGHVVSGVPNKNIAIKLNLSEKTVEVHRSHAMKKMQAGSLAELVRMVALVCELPAPSRDLESTRPLTWRRESEAESRQLVGAAYG